MKINSKEVLPKRSSEEVLKRLKKRGIDSYDDIVKRDLNRLHALYAIALSEVELSVAEALAICTTLQGIELNNPMIYLNLSGPIYDAMEYEYLEERCNIDCLALVEKANKLSLIHTMALVDAAERFWVEVASVDCVTEDFVKKIFRIKD